MADTIITNQAQFAFDYNGTPVTGESNEVTTTIVNIDPTKSVDKDLIVSSTDDGVLTYTLVFSNTSNEPLTDIMMSDAIPGGSSFIDGSLKVDGNALTLQPSGTLAPMTYRIESGVLKANIGSAALGQTLTIVFKVQAAL